MINFYLKNRIEIKRKMKRKIFRRVESHYLLKSVKNTGKFGQIYSFINKNYYY